MDEREAVQAQLELVERERESTQERIDRQGDIRDRLEAGTIDVKQALIEFLNLSICDLERSMNMIEEHARVMRDAFGGPKGTD